VVGVVTLDDFRDFALRIPVPENSTYVSASLAGGSNLGPGTPTASLSGGDIVVTVPGPVPGGSAFTFPTVDLTLDAGSTLGTTIAPRIGGSSFADPGLTFTVDASIPGIGETALPTSCYPAPPVPALSTTTIGLDTTPPSVNLVVPAEGGNYSLGAPVHARFSCTDEQYGSGLAGCVGDVADGAAIDTSTLGVHSFGVTTTDNAGNTNVVTHSYNVIPPGGDTTPPSITLTTPVGGRLPRGRRRPGRLLVQRRRLGVATCAGPVASGSGIDTSSAGVKTFTVDATDNAGNPAGPRRRTRFSPRRPAPSVRSRRAGWSRATPPTSTVPMSTSG